MDWWQILLICIACVIVSAVATFFITRHFFQKQIEENPPINEDMIRAMYMQMGRKPSEAQIRAVMNNVNKHKK
jgi:uncharacterized protein